mgnify:CR=1 FL=1
MIKPLIFHFLLSLSAATAAFSWIADPKLTGAGFIRLITGHGAIFFALFCIGVFLDAGWHLLPVMLMELVLLLCFIAQWRLHPDGKTPAMWALFVVQIILTAAFFKLESRNGEIDNFLFILSSGLFLGITHYAMLLGHYYLVVPKLTEKPLLVSMKILWAFMGIKLVWSLINTMNASHFLVEQTTAGDGYIFNWITISMRWLWGYGAMAILSYFAWRLCRMRSIQSATGVLYIMVFFVFIGELLSAYLFFKHGLKI